jgi:hypothetical protein
VLKLRLPVVTLMYPVLIINARSIYSRQYFMGCYKNTKGEFGRAYLGLAYQLSHKYLFKCSEELMKIVYNIPYNLLTP